MLDKFDKNMESVENTFYNVEKNKKVGGSTFFNENLVNAVRDK